MHGLTVIQPRGTAQVIMAESARSTLLAAAGRFS
jgi:hypothetical protein